MDNTILKFLLGEGELDGVWYGENFEAYAIEVSPTRGIKNFWATVAVKTGE
jgi:hypothetical protein